MLDTTGTRTSSASSSTEASAGRPITPAVAALDALLASFLASRYDNPNTVVHYRRLLERCFRSSGRRHPADLTAADLLAWCTNNGAPIANNSVRSRTALLRVFLDWCVLEGHITVNPMHRLNAPGSPLARYHRTYGKVQAPNPARWLDKHQAFTQLIGACQDGTHVGLRDEIVCRLGLLGMRASEIGHLTVGNLHRDGSRRISWTGKGHKPREVTAGPALADCLNQYLRLYRAAVGRELDPADPLICRQIVSRWHTGLDWCHPYSTSRNSIWRLITLRAAAAGLGHVAPHDLRRSAAGILHNDKTNGAHNFDLLDIQKMLDHSDPATTMRCYLDPMDTGVKTRAASVLD